MEKRIASPSLRDDPNARTLLEQLERVANQLQLTSSVAYYEFPLFRDDRDELLTSQTMFASRETGLLFFLVCTDVHALEQADEFLSQLYALALGRLVKNPRLRKDRQTLAFELETCVYFPAGTYQGSLSSKIVTSEQSLVTYLREKKKDPVSLEVWEELISTIEGSAALRREKEKGLATAPIGSKGAILSQILSRITSFDQDQRRAAITLVDGPQRIRGIAGSGKTVVLAMKAAHIHLKKPDADILVTYWTKNLYDQFKFHITRFYRQFSDKDPDWDRIHILHAWGGRTVGGGVYYNAAIAAGVTPMTVADLKRFGARPTFEKFCHDLILTGQVKQFYDYSLIDEGQDLPASFYQLCFALTKGGEIDRNVIWAYDELQTILDVNVQNVVNTFGSLKDGRARVDLQRAEEQISQGLQPHDIVLKRSYRNPAEVIIAAHALGFGIYSEKIVQILENARHWEDLGYSIVEGSCVPGKRVRIRRPPQYSPINISSYPGAGNVIEARSFAKYGDELAWILRELRSFLDSGLRPQDLLIISLDDRNAKRYFADLSMALLEGDLAVNNLSLTSFGSPNFFVDGSTTLSTVYKAKGNEAAVVFVVGVDGIAFDIDPVKARNKLFAAMSRSKAWLRVSGVDPMAAKFVDEIHQAVKNFPDLVFVYPDPGAVRTIQRDLAERSAKLMSLQKTIEELGLSNLSEDEILALIRNSTSGEKGKFDKKKK